ncbi:MAG: Asp-tRNA(Asn)/Glu-tRNA(Gln) amidotransferase subunit GatC [Paracoccaceae bacterium]
MSIDRETVRKVAHLARIAVAEEDEAALAGELSQILGWVEQLQAVDVTDIEPLSAVHPIQIPMRADAVTDGGMQDKILANAPDAREGFFVVPKVVE